MGKPVYEVTYEDLQADADKAMENLFIYLGISRVIEKAKVKKSSDGWVKRTSDDLTHHVDNFDELRSCLRSANSRCLVAQLEASVPGVSFPPCPLPATWGRLGHLPATTGGDVKHDS